MKAFVLGLAIGDEFSSWDFMSRAMNEDVFKGVYYGTGYAVRGVFISNDMIVGAIIT